MKLCYVCLLLFLFAGRAAVGADQAVVSPVLSPTPSPSGTGGAAKESATTFPRYGDTGVYHVNNETRPSKNRQKDACVARRGDVVTIYVKHLKAWLNDPRNQDRFPKDAKVTDLIPFLDDVPLTGIHPEQNWAEPADVDSVEIPQVHYLRFTLERTETSKEQWTRILNHPRFTKPMKVSVGFENGEEITTYVLPTAAKTENRFIFTLIPPFRFWLGVEIILGAFIVVLSLARWTDIIRDTTAPLRPDKRWPYSLSRTQMAFWFFLVLAAFFFLWVIIGATDTLNTSVLGLIGISASTTVASVFVDSGRAPATPSQSDLPAVDLSQPRRKICLEICALIDEAKKDLKKLEQNRGAIDPHAEALLAANAEAQTLKKGQIDDLERQLDYFRRPAWKGVMYDLLTEKNEDKKVVVEFHRFQILIWTIVLGIMFVANVYNQLAMPQFSATLLGLLGISAGTYVGLKIPDSEQAKTS